MMKRRGFTLVELLIVIVVVALLAAISVVAYGRMTDRAINSSAASAANQAIKLVNSYVGTYGVYPPVNRSCMTADTCLYGGQMVTNATFKSEIGKIGTLPADVPTWNPTYGGVMYDYNASRTYEGESSPAVVYFYLKGQQTCGLPVMAGTSPNYVASTNGYSTWVSSANSTICIVRIAGPAA